MNEPLDRLGEHLARELDALQEASRNRAEVSARLEEIEPTSVSARRSYRPILRAGVAGLAIAAAAAAIVLVRYPRAPEAPLGLFIGQSPDPVPAGRWIEAPASEQIALRFSDGSHIEVGEQSRARVVDLRPHGADVLLETGTIDVQVRHYPESAWHISAGPFGVRVTGTRFHVRWTPEDDAFELQLDEGHVELTGCMFGKGYAVQTGQTVRASCRNERFDVSFGASAAAAPAASATPTATDTGAPAAAASGSAPSLPAADSGQTPNRPSPQSQRGPQHPAARRSRAADWRTLARSGRFAEALVLVNATGFATQCKRADAEQLGLLADLAHYGHDVGAEERALRLLRKRFAGSKRAAQAAFELGRLQFDGKHAYAAAADWFVTYLREAPSGELSREARGRLIEALDRSGRDNAARELATTYLRDYPNGPHAELARSLTRNQRL